MGLWVYTKSHKFASTLERIFNLWNDVPNWPKWDPDIQTSSGSLSGASPSLTILMKNGRTHVPMIQQIKSPKDADGNKSVAFSYAIKLPGAVMEFTHSASLESDGQVTLEHGTKITGFMSWIWGKAFAGMIQHGVDAAVETIPKILDAPAASSPPSASS